MKFTIVTPTLNNWSWLEGCIKSVADQAAEGIHVHHHVQDGASTDGTAAQLAAWQEASLGTPNYSFSFESCPDAGMYDAINLAWAKMPEDTDFMAHLNSDEQYLPHALASVVPYFDQHPKAEVLLGSYIILDDELGYIAHRRPVQPKLWSSWFNCACITNSAFYRASAFRARQMHFDTTWKISSDLVFFRNLLKQGVHFQTIPVLTSTFVCTGANLAWSPAVQEESQRHHAEAPFFYKLLGDYPRHWVNIKRRLNDRFLAPPSEYQIYEQGEAARTRIAILQPTCRWKMRTQANPTAYQR